MSLDMDKIAHDKWEKHWNNVFLEYPDESVIRYIAREDTKKAGSGQKRILDFGCGTGRHAVAMAKRGYEVTAADYTETCLEIVKKRALEEGVDIETVHNASTQIPLPDKRFDIVVAFGSLFYNTKEKNIALLKELNRITQLNGEIFTDCRTHDDHEYLKAKDGLADGTYQQIHTDCFFIKTDQVVRFFPSIEDIKESFETGGFEVYEIEKKEFTKNNGTLLHSWWQIYGRKIKEL